MRWTDLRRLLVVMGLLGAITTAMTMGGEDASAEANPTVRVFLTTTPTPNAGLISGFVTDGGNGLPATQVEVCAINFASTLCTSTFSSGRYRLSPLPPGNFFVRFRALDRFEEQCWQSTSCDEPTWISIAGVEDFENINATMQPLAGLPPTPTPTNTPTPTPPITPDPTPTSLPIDATVTPTNTPTPTATAVEATPTPPIGDAEAVITGRITVLATGDPVFGAKVCATLTFPAFERCAFSAFDGGYSIRDLTPGNYAVGVSDPGQRFTDNCWGTRPCANPQLIGVDRNELATDIDIAMDSVFSASVPTPTPPPPSPEGSIAGQVLVDGQPRAGVEVCAADLVRFVIVSCTTSDSDGSYVVTGLPTANYTIEATIYEALAPIVELLRFCYRDDPGCRARTSVGVVSPFSRSNIDLRLESSEFDEARLTITPTPVPTSGAVPTPTLTPTASEPTPTPTPTPTTTATPVPDPNAPVPYSDFDRNGPWADVPHVGTLGVGTYETGTYRFGSDVAPVLELMSAYFGAPSGALAQGRVTWWGPNQDRPLALIEADAADRLVAASINLEENGRLGLPPVFLGDIWLFSGDFALDAFGLDTDRFLYLRDDPEGNAIRCASDNFCTRQRVERNAAGQVVAFGNIIEFFADASSASSTRIVRNVTADGRVQLFTDPYGGAPALRSIDLSGGVTAGVIGFPITNNDGTWVRLTEGRDPLQPAGWARADGLRDAPVADRFGPLPRFTVNPPELAPLIGEIHTDIFDSVAELLGIDDPRSGSGGGIYYDSDGEPLYAGQFVRDGTVHDQVLSTRLPDGNWQIVSTSRLEIGTDQVVIAPTTGRCPRFGGAPNDTLIVTNLDKDAVAVWELHDGEFRPGDPTGVRCDLRDRG